MKEIDANKKERIIRKLHEIGIKNLTISGGEPMIDKDLKPIIELANKLGMKILVQTNGTRINEEIAEFLKSKNAFLEISLEGTEDIHNKVTKSNNFGAAIKGIKIAAAKGIPICANFTITKVNMGCLDNYLKLIESLGINIANFTKLYPSGNALININIMPTENENLEFLKKLSELQFNTRIILNVQPGFRKEILEAAGIIYSNKCPASKEITISPDGSVKACPSWPISHGNLLSWYEMPEIESDGCAIEEVLQAKVNKAKNAII